jgi:NAD(P)-dependent dehydrogenase (short-subunit alcohol dehydrogenase family)
VTASAGRPDYSVTGKIALVTGATRGLGREIALGLAAAGADVVVVSRKAEACEAAAREIKGRTGREAYAFPCHVGHWQEIDRLVDAVYARHGRIDVLVNNAGMSPQYGRLDEVSEELYDKVLAVNLKGPFRLTALIGTRMAQGSGGSVINISSIAAVRPNPNNLPYCAAKAGLNVITTGYARAFGPSVRVNAIMAGPFNTRVSEAWTAEYAEQIIGGQALERLGEPAEIVGAVLYLASNAASYTTGSVMAVDGGMP